MGNLLGQVLLARAARGRLAASVAAATITGMALTMTVSASAARHNHATHAPAAPVAATPAPSESIIARTRDFPTSAAPALTDVYPDRVTHFPGGVTGLADVVYASNVGYRPQVGDIYLPPASLGTAPKPLILYIHGGGWIAGHTRHNGALSNFPEVLASLAAEGFVVASLEYRLSAEAPFPAQLQDSRAALRFLRANAGRYGIDGARVGVWGGSAGGHLTALTALTCGVSSLDAPLAPGASTPAAGSECVQAAVTWYGVYDFAPMLARTATVPGSPPNLLIRCRPDDCPAERVAAVSPVTYIDRSDPPFLLIHGDADTQVPVAQSHLAEERLRAAGVPVEAIYIPGAEHSFIMATPEQTHSVTMRAINATFDFFHRKLGVR